MLAIQAHGQGVAADAARDTVPGVLERWCRVVEIDLRTTAQPLPSHIAELVLWHGALGVAAPPPEVFASTADEPSAYAEKPQQFDGFAAVCVPETPALIASAEDAADGWFGGRRMHLRTPLKLPRGRPSMELVLVCPWHEFAPYMYLVAIERGCARLQYEEDDSNAGSSAAMRLFKALVDLCAEPEQRMCFVVQFQHKHKRAVGTSEAEESLYLCVHDEGSALMMFALRRSPPQSFLVTHVAQAAEEEASDGDGGTSAPQATLDDLLALPVYPGAKVFRQEQQALLSSAQAATATTGASGSEAAGEAWHPLLAARAAAHRSRTSEGADAEAQDDDDDEAVDWVGGFCAVQEWSSLGDREAARPDPISHEALNGYVSALANPSPALLARVARLRATSADQPLRWPEYAALEGIGQRAAPRHSDAAQDRGRLSTAEKALMDAAHRTTGAKKLRKRASTSDAGKGGGKSKRRAVEGSKGKYASSSRQQRLTEASRGVEAEEARARSRSRRDAVAVRVLPHWLPPRKAPSAGAAGRWRVRSVVGRAELVDVLEAHHARGAVDSPAADGAPVGPPPVRIPADRMCIDYAQVEEAERAALLASGSPAAKPSWRALAEVLGPRATRRLTAVPGVDYYRPDRPADGGASWFELREDHIRKATLPVRDGGMGWLRQSASIISGVRRSPVRGASSNTLASPLRRHAARAALSAQGTAKAKPPPPPPPKFNAPSHVGRRASALTKAAHAAATRSRAHRGVAVASGARESVASTSAARAARLDPAAASTGGGSAAADTSRAANASSLAAAAADATQAAAEGDDFASRNRERIRAAVRRFVRTLGAALQRQPQVVEKIEHLAVSMCVAYFQIMGTVTLTQGLLPETEIDAEAQREIMTAIDRLNVRSAALGIGEMDDGSIDGESVASQKSSSTVHSWLVPPPRLGMAARRAHLPRMGFASGRGVRRARVGGGGGSAQAAAPLVMLSPSSVGVHTPTTGNAGTPTALGGGGAGAGAGLGMPRAVLDFGGPVAMPPPAPAPSAAGARAHVAAVAVSAQPYDVAPLALPYDAAPLVATAVDGPACSSGEGVVAAAAPTAAAPAVTEAGNGAAAGGDGGDGGGGDANAAAAEGGAGDAQHVPLPVPPRVDDVRG